MSNPALIVLSAETQSELQASTKDIATEIKELITNQKNQLSEDDQQLANVAERLLFRPSRPCRAAVVASSLEELHGYLLLISEGKVRPDSSLESNRIAISTVGDNAPRALFLYPGQGSQAVAEHSRIAEAYPRFAKIVRQLEQNFTQPALSQYLSAAWKTNPRPSPELAAQLRDTAVSQPMLAVTAIAFTKILADLGVAPTSALGHSVGEFGSLYAAGLADSHTIVRLIAERVRCMTKIGPSGGMTAIHAGRADISTILERNPDVALACDNSPTQTVIGGDEAALSRAENDLTTLGLAFTRLKTSGAFHTPAFAEADSEFSVTLAATNYSSEATLSPVTCVSSISGRKVDSWEEARNLLAHQTSSPVRFREALTAAAALNPEVIIQVSGGNTLIDMYRQTNPGYTGRLIGFGGNRDNQSALCINLGELFLAFPNFQIHKWNINKGVSTLKSRGLTIENSFVREPKPTTDLSPVLRTATAGADQDVANAQRVEVMAPQAADQGEIQLRTAVVELLQEQLSTLALAFHTDPSRLPVASVGTAPVAETPTASQGQTTTILVSESGDPSSTTSTDPNPAEAQIVEILAKTTGYRVEDISSHSELVSDLGFDSLMLTNIFAQLNHQFPSWTPDEETTSSIKTLDDLVASITGREFRPVVETEPSASTLGPTVRESAQPQEPVSPPEADPQSGPIIEVGSRIVDLPEVKATTEQFAQVRAEGIRIPYYVAHESPATSVTKIEGEEYLSFSSYNYLGLAAHPEVIAAVQNAVATFGTSASAARILSGNRPFHNDLEAAIAELCGTEDAVVMVGGHSTNASIIPHFYNDEDIVFHDSLAHDSIHQGIRASGAVRHSYQHNSLELLERALIARRHRFRRALIVTEGIFSMDGDIPDLPALVAIARKYDAHLMVDEAHSIAVLGSTGGGICEETGVDPAEVDILMGTLSKSMASCGGYIAGSKALIEHLRYNLSSLVFSAAITPANAVAALTAISVLKREPERLRRLRANSKYFLQGARDRGLNVGDAIGVPVVPVIVGDSDKSVALANLLHQQRVSVNPIVFPAVANNLSRLRFFITSEHSEAQMDFALDKTAEILDSLRES